MISPTRTYPAALLLLAALASPTSAMAANEQEGRLEGSVWTALTLNRHLSAYGIQVTAAKGTITLRGKVESATQRQLAADIARLTPDVTGVDNQLVLDPALGERFVPQQALAAQINDLNLTATVREKLAWNTSTYQAPIEVSTDSGVVTLKGPAPTAAAKQLAGDLANNTEGVYQVNNLISLSAADTATTAAETQAKQTEEQLSDNWISGKVTASLVYSRNLDGLKIEVQVREGLVRLKGEVTSTEERALAVELARNVRGVRGVDADVLKINSGFES